MDIGLYKDCNPVTGVAQPLLSVEALTRTENLTVGRYVNTVVICSSVDSAGIYFIFQIRNLIMIEKFVLT